MGYANYGERFRSGFDMPCRMSRFHTNLAAEFFVLSCLHRLGADAHLTLGNNKSVDLVVVRAAGDVVTLDVKGLAGKTCWFVQNIPVNRKRHFVVFVSFLGRINNPIVFPEVYIVPSEAISRLRTKGENQAVPDIRLSTLKKEGKEYLNAWKQIL
jgi:hypothetical protein